jgi:hypothetical protein
LPTFSDLVIIYSNQQLAEPTKFHFFTDFAPGGLLLPFSKKEAERDNFFSITADFFYSSFSQYRFLQLPSFNSF